MNNLYQHYIIDLSSNNNFVQIPTVQGDGNNIRGFEVELIENGVQYEIDQNDCVIAIMGTKPDTSQIMNDCQLTDDGYIQVDITSQMSAVKGRGEYQIVLMSKSTNSQLKSFPFHIFTTPATFDIDHIVSTDEFQTLTRNIVKTEEVIEEANDTISDMRDLESSVEKAEKARVNAEKSRIDAEATRQSNESTRQSNENTRNTNENTRKANEISRQAAETDRDNAETDRDNAESYRMTNEAARQNNEIIRQTNETIRQTNTTAAITNADEATERANNAAIVCEDIISESGIVAQKATEAANSATSASTSAANALASEKNAKTSETNAAKSELAAATSATNAANSEATANEKAAEALNYSEQAKSYAVGGTGTRTEEDIDNAKYYYEQARGISSGLAGTLMPMGTVNFANLPTLSSVDSGWMYNISDQFTTTSDFKEGSGHIIPAGANIYKTADEKWDVLAGTPVTGIKGSAESSYRKGNVDLTAENIGLGKVPNVSTNDQTPTFTQATARANIASGEKLSTIMGKIMKFFADLKTVAFSGKYSDLTGTPIIPTASITTPKANGTAAVGTEAAFARGDHAHPAQTTISGNAGSATKLATARTIDGVSFNGSAAITHYGTCSTAAATAAKEVAITGFSLVAGAVVRVKFTATNTVANPTLNVNNTGAKAIHYRGAAISARYLAANRTYEFVYNGTQYELVGDVNTNTTYSNMTGATSSAAGKAGLVPAPAAGAQAKYLRGDGSWQELPDSIYQRHDALSDGTPIVTNSTDWNTLTSPGSYKVTSGSTIADGINAPTGEYGNGLMFVIRNIDSNNQSYIFQLYFPTVPRFSAMWIRYSYGTNVDTTGSLVWGYWIKSPWVNNNNYTHGLGDKVYFTNADNTVTKAGIVMQNYRSYGVEMLIGAGGNTFIGAGESVVYAPQWLSDNTVEWPHGKPAYDGPGGEIMYFTSDSGFYFLSNMGSLDNNGAVRGRFICIDTNSHLYPSEDRAQQLGRSGNRWSKVWANEIGMGGTTDNSRIVWADDGILRFFGANKARIGTDSGYLDISGVTLNSEAIIARAASRIESNRPYMIKCTDGKSSTHLIIGVLNPNATTSDTTITSSGSTLNILTNGGGLRVLNQSSTSIDGVSTTLVYDPIAASKFLTYSSSRYKENIRNMTEEEALQILKYRVVSYDYKVEYGGEKDQQGLIAEEAYDINSFQVSLDEDGQPSSIDYSKFVPQLIKMVQIQQEQINNLKNEIAMLENNKNS